MTTSALNNIIVVCRYFVSVMVKTLREILISIRRKPANMSITNLCAAYLSSTASGNWSNWKESLHNIGMELKMENHPDYAAFNEASCTLMMNDAPGYWNWFNATITKLVNDSTSRLEPLPVLPDYDELSSQRLVELYDSNDGNYSKHGILFELKERYPSLIQSDLLSNFDKLEVNLSETLKSVL